MSDGTAKRGRPPSPPHLRRGMVLTIRLTTAEYQRIQEAARVSHDCPSNFIRAAANDRAAKYGPWQKPGADPERDEEPEPGTPTNRPLRS